MGGSRGLVRAPRMVDAAPTSTVAVDLHRVSGRSTVAYRDVATWMVAEAERAEFVNGAPFVSGA